MPRIFLLNDRSNLVGAELSRCISVEIAEVVDPELPEARRVIGFSFIYFSHFWPLTRSI